MAGSVNKVILVADYVGGMSLPTVARKHGISPSTARFHVKNAGALRSRAEGVRLAGQDGRLGAGARGKARTFSEDHRRAIQASAAARGASALGISVKPSGYVEYTKGPHKGRSVHVVAMEQRIGRRLLRDEVVHHIDGDPANNEPNNLALMTRSGHTRLHRFEDGLAGNIRERDENGRFC